MSAYFALVGKALWLRATDAVVTVYHDFKPVATHARARRPGERRTVSDHLPPAAQRFFAHDRSWSERALNLPRDAVGFRLARGKDM